MMVKCLSGGLMPLFAAVVMMASIPLAHGAEDRPDGCDCSVFPFRPDPPCAKQCFEKLNGRPIYDRDGQQLGTVAGLKFDSYGQVRDVMGREGERLFDLPLHDLEVNTSSGVVIFSRPAPPPRPFHHDRL